MTVREANYLTGGARLRVLKAGLERHGLESEDREGNYISQFESPAHGRMIIVDLSGDGAFGFALEELELASNGNSGNG